MIPPPQPETTRAGTTCPKCGHRRSAESAAPAWQCPACGIAYAKYRAYLARVHQAVTPPAAGANAPPLGADGSVWMLLGSNLVALIAALVQGWSTSSLMIVYWMQSVAIGVSNVYRILALERFSTENFTMNDRPVDPTPATRRQVAAFFAFHYGFFHVGYLVFILAEGERGLLSEPWVWSCALVFAVNHAFSYRYHRDLDRRGTPNIGTLMFMPYVRIVPMHLTIVFGGFLAHSGLGVLVFGTLKTAADIAMHAIEHARLRAVRCAS